MQEFLPTADKEWFNYRMQLKMKSIIPTMILSLIFLLLIPLVSAETTFFDQDDAFIMANSNAAEGTTEEIHHYDDDSEILCEYNMTVEFDTAAEYENNEDEPVEIPSAPKTETPETETPKIGIQAPPVVVSLGAAWISLVAIIAAFISWKVIERYSKKRARVRVNREKSDRDAYS
jgi:hypothetical protein